ncbi:hypothetical protein GPECTOR_114g315 [Gonium pectorale]|uniref:Uncharacterized protein n=1 Tax=Gonium pectorale TaxID=33097 RepID=A0A150FZ35_GONPE|nr:hypothetical protein GPECTOR_114g315 [Gonium pectorale]|eukprot:KXZ42864.1 hypothetical protein GPECTOR_114g315 [Gonium pectorale]
MLPTTSKATGAQSTRGYATGHSPGAGTSTLSASSAIAVPNMSKMMDLAAQEALKEKLSKFKQDKAAQRPAGPAVPSLNMSALREAAQAREGQRSARGNGGTYAGTANGHGAAAPPLSARGQPGAARQQAQQAYQAPRAAAGPGAAANAAKAPPVPRLLVSPAGEQQLRVAVTVPLPKDELWEAAQVALPADADDGTALATARTPSSRITKSPLRGAVMGPGGTWPGIVQPQLMQPPPPPAPQLHQHPQRQPQAQPQAQQQQPAAHGARSPQPGNRTVPAGSSTAGPAAGGGGGSGAGSGAEHLGSRAASNAEASTSDIGGRPIRDQIKLAKMQGQRQLAACSMLLADMMEQKAKRDAAIAAAEAMARTRHVIETQLPLLEEWRVVQAQHGLATQEMLTALQNAMTSLPLVNGAGLGLQGGDTAQTLLQLRRALASGLGSLQSAEGAMRLMLQGGQGQGQGGVPAMAALLPQLYETLVAEVSGLRSLLTALDDLAVKLDATASLRARTAAVVATKQPEPADPWVDRVNYAELASLLGSKQGADMGPTIDAALSALGLGMGG